ncbi:MAG: aldehyde dehydrogenase family protein [Gammaproteobacteria bacterium]|nr:aldehyde dehydrogenase family protein [Gammaproteobacteria bacterium]
MGALTDLDAILTALSMPGAVAHDGSLAVYSPIDGNAIAGVATDDSESLRRKVEAAERAYSQWRGVPAPRRGELIRLFGEELRRHKDALGALVTLETGKIHAEGLGEVQEMIDICDFAVGLSRQLYGLTMPSERPGHRMAELWHPMGVIGVISAFNFPVAVWSWNTALALVCGNSVVWKPSEKTPLCALACQALFERAAAAIVDVPPKLVQVVVGDAGIGDVLVRNPHVPVVSATGSTRMGRAVAPVVAERFGRCILELGGNNGMIVTSSADLELAVRAILFSAVGTAGQRCTTLRRLIVHERVHDELIASLHSAFDQVRVGNPFEPGTVVGPLIDASAFDAMQHALGVSGEAGFEIQGGQRVDVAGCKNGHYVQPAIVCADVQNAIVKAETFAPILYVIPYSEFDEALALHNDVPQGLSSCVFTRNLLEAEEFLSAEGSDCGIANVNIGPSGAEIGGAFGGEKETGGGRESGSDAWKGYMRRCTATVNYSSDLPLAQGIEFGTGGAGAGRMS